MNNQSDILTEFERHKKVHGIVFFAIGWIFSLQIIFAATYLVWLFKNPVSNLFLNQEFQALFFIHIIYPIVGLILFLTGKKLGWSLIVFCSILNVTYAIVVYLTELKLDIAILFFLTYVFLIGLLYQKSLIEEFNISRRWLTKTTCFALIIAITFMLLLIFV